MRLGSSCLVLIALLVLPGPTATFASSWDRPQPLRSDLESLSPSTQAMQRRDTDNPAWFSVLNGERLYSQPEGSAQRACADCHSASAPMTQYPRFDDRSGQPLDLSGRIESCRLNHQGAQPWAREDERRLSLLSYVSLQSRGQIIRPDSDPRLDASRQRGRERYVQRIGQLGLSCADCHDRHWGQRLGGSPIPQGHPNAYPIWRMQWQSLGSLQRRLRACLAGVRAEPWPAEDVAWIELELYLQWRATGLALEAPGVRP